MEIPESWPPSDERFVVPVFPLPNQWLFPRTVRPLHVFEPRYRQLIEDSLDGPGRLVWGTVVEGHEPELAGAPPIHPIAGLGEIGRHEKLADGRFHVFLVGLGRVRVREVESDHPYRQVEVEPLYERAVGASEDRALRPELIEALQARTEEQSELADVALEQLADYLVMSLPLPHAVLNELYSELDVAVRARRALEEHARYPVDDDG